MKRYVWMSALAALTITFSATAAQATPITLDFTTDLYLGVNNDNDFETVDQGVTVTLSSYGGWLTHNAVTGIGINGWGLGGDNGEVGDGEIVLSGFDPSLHVYEVTFAQLFDNEGLGGFHEETGYYRINHAGWWIPFTATYSDGAYSLVLNQGGVSSIAFAGDCVGVACAFDDDFSIKSMRVEGPTVNTVPEVPEPAALILLGAGFLGAAARRRKKNQAA